jgi:hypothetical protein
MLLPLVSDPSDLSPLARRVKAVTLPNSTNRPLADLLSAFSTSESSSGLLVADCSMVSPLDKKFISIICITTLPALSMLCGHSILRTTGFLRGYAKNPGCIRDSRAFLPARFSRLNFSGCLGHGHHRQINLRLHMSAFELFSRLQVGPLAVHAIDRSY